MAPNQSRLVGDGWSPDLNTFCCSVWIIHFPLLNNPIFHKRQCLEAREPVSEAFFSRMFLRITTVLLFVEALSSGFGANEAKLIVNLNSTVIDVAEGDQFTIQAIPDSISSHNVFIVLEVHTKEGKKVSLLVFFVLVSLKSHWDNDEHVRLKLLRKNWRSVNEQD